MKKILSILLLMTFVAGCVTTNKPSTIENVPNFPETLYIAVPKANIRQQPTTESRILTQLPIGTKVKIIQQKDDWYRVEYQEKKTGWVHKSALAISDSK